MHIKKKTMLLLGADCWVIIALIVLIRSLHFPITSYYQMSNVFVSLLDAINGIFMYMIYKEMK